MHIDISLSTDCLSFSGVKLARGEPNLNSALFTLLGTALKKLVLKFLTFPMQSVRFGGGAFGFPLPNIRFISTELSNLALQKAESFQG